MNFPLPNSAFNLGLTTPMGVSNFAFPNGQNTPPITMAALPTPDSFMKTAGAIGNPVSVPTAYQPPISTPTAITSRSLTPNVWHNDLKQMFHRNEAVLYALNIRTFGAFDKNGDGRISARLGENGTFLSAIKRLDELKALGVNTLHLLPINPTSQAKRFGEAGSLYATSDYHNLNQEFDTPGNNTDVVQEARQFIEECHKRGIHVMVDVPSCASYDLVEARPDLILKDAEGKTLTPTRWVDIAMFKNDQNLQDYYEGFFDLMVNKVGVDGFRVDVARARPPEFWQHFISKYPDKAWLAETYCEEDQSPLLNLPRDIPEALMKSGFDSMYGQFHIFHSMSNAKEYTDYLLQLREMFQRASQTGGNDKSVIGSFLTHDDPSLMEKGGVPICLLSSGLMATQPWTNPYIMDGFTTGYKEDFDIFNFVPRPTGEHPEIGQFLNHMLQLRKNYGPVLTQGSYIPIPIKGEENNQIIAFARQAQGKTLLIVANKDINARHQASLEIPGLSPQQPLQNLAPEYGLPDQVTPQANGMTVDLGPASFLMYEINTPNLGQTLPSY